MDNAHLPKIGIILQFGSGEGEVSTLYVRMTHTNPSNFASLPLMEVVEIKNHQQNVKCKQYYYLLIKMVENFNTFLAPAITNLCQQTKEFFI